MDITRRLLKLVDNMMDSASNDPNTSRGLCKAAGAGFIEGVMDGILISVPVVIVAGIIGNVLTKNE